MWLNLVSMGLKTAGHIYKNKQRTKMLMSDEQSMHAEKMARGEIEYKAKVIESNDKLDRRVRLGTCIFAYSCTGLFYLH